MSTTSLVMNLQPNLYMNHVMAHDLKTLGERLAYALDQNGMTEADLGKRLDPPISQQAVNKAIRGKSQKPKWLYDACRILKANYDWVLSGQGPKTVDDERREQAWLNLYRNASEQKRQAIFSLISDDSDS